MIRGSSWDKPRDRDTRADGFSRRGSAPTTGRTPPRPAAQPSSSRASGGARWSCSAATRSCSPRCSPTPGRSRIPVHRDDPLHRCARLLTKADERLDDRDRENSSVCLTRATRAATCMRKKSSARSMRKPIQCSSRVRRTARPRHPRRAMPDQVPPSRPVTAALKGPDHLPAPGARTERADRSGEHLDPNVLTRTPG